MEKETKPWDEVGNPFDWILKKSFEWMNTLPKFSPAAMLKSIIGLKTFASTRSAAFAFCALTSRTKRSWNHCLLFDNILVALTSHNFQHTQFFQSFNNLFLYCKSKNHITSFKSKNSSILIRLHAYVHVKLKWLLPSFLKIILCMHVQ